MKIKYDNRTFASVKNSSSGQVGRETTFYYRQNGNVVWANYAGGDIVRGHLIATCDLGGVLDMRYQHINARGELMTGKCISTPEMLDDGRVRLYEKWQWTSGDRSSGESVLEEIIAPSRP